MTALESALARRGARTGDRAGRRAVLDLGDVAGETAALAGGAGAVALLGWAAQSVTGADARAFLHRMLTQDVRSLAPGSARPAALLDVRGRVQGEGLLWALPDRFVLAGEPAALARLVPALARYVVADDVALADASAAWAHVLVTGPRTEAVVAAARVGLDAAGACATRADLGTAVAVRVLVPAARGGDVLDALEAAGARVVGEAALDRARVAAAAPWWGVEVDERVMPTEAGARACVSFSKGCYLGQEPVVMAEHRGRPAWTLVRVAVPPGALPPRDAPLRGEGGATGRVTTAVPAAEGDGVVALALLRTDAARVGAVLHLDDGRAAVVEVVAR